MLRQFNAVKIREVVVPSPPGSDTKYTQDRVIVAGFEYSKINSEHFASLASRAGAKGHFQFQSENGPKLMSQVLLMNSKRDSLGIIHVGFDGPASPTFVTSEGSGKSCPSSNDFWYMGDNAVRAGNSINTSISGISVWNWAQGNDVRVAVIDTGFLRTTENPLQGVGLNPALLGNDSHHGGIFYRYNFRSNPPSPGVHNINVYTPGSSQYSAPNGHGRKMTALIFSKYNDSQGIAGVAPYAIPYLFETDWGYGQVGSAVDTARSWGVHIINMSFGTYITTWMAPFVAWAVPLSNANGANVICIGSTGNDGDGDFYPSGYSFVMGVSAHDEWGNVANFGGGQVANTYYADIYAGGDE